MTLKKPLLLGIAGPTASGKTALSLMLREAYPIEIVCMDSMQVYQKMDIGTAKPDKAQRALVPHHMLDVLPPDRDYSVAQYQRDAAQAVDGILAHGALPVLVGGTGLYLRALSLPLDLGGTAGDEALRRRYEDLLTREGPEMLHGRLAACDPETALRLHPNDTRRVIRALEVFELTGRPFSLQKMPGYDDGPYDIRLYAFDWPRDTLYARVDSRVDEMLGEGLIDEVRALRALGVGDEAQSMQGLGYKELLPYLRGETGLEETAELIKRRTRNYAKRQLAWFRRDPRIRWLRPDIAREEFLRLVKGDIER